MDSYLDHSGVRWSLSHRASVREVEAISPGRPLPGCCACGFCEPHHNKTAQLIMAKILAFAQWGVMYAALHHGVGTSVPGIDSTQTTGAKVHIHSCSTIIRNTKSCCPSWSSFRGS